MSPEPILPSVKSYPKSTESKWARMESWFLTLLTFNLLLLISSCGLDIEDPTPPSPPVWVEKSLPEEWPERGIDAHESGGIYLEWEPSIMSDNIAGYIIQRAERIKGADSLSEFEHLIFLEPKMFNNDFIDIDVSFFFEYVYRLKSEDFSGNFSGFSEWVTYSLLRSVSSDELAMAPSGGDTLGLNRQLSWYYRYTIEMQDFIITLLGNDTELLNRTRIVPSRYTNGIELWSIPDTIYLLPNQRYEWRIDMSANYSGGRETSGAESTWGYFYYSGR
jgi:hypothetical protein